MLKRLKNDDIIRIGVYEGETVKDCIRKYEDDQDKQDWIQELLDSPVPVGGSFVTTTTQDEDEETLDLYQEYENDLDYYDNSVSYDPEDDDEFGGNGNSYKPWIYGR